MAKAENCIFILCPFFHKRTPMTHALCAKKREAQICMGARMSYTAMKTFNRNFSSFLYLISSQFRDASTGVILSLFLVLVNSLAAAFCTSCKQDKEAWLGKKNKTKQIIYAHIITYYSRLG